MSPRAFAFAALSAALTLAGCGGHGAAVPASLSPMAVRPPSVSPALIKPAPMVKTARLPASAMRSPADRHVDSVGRDWTQLPGSASQVAAGYDGTLWVLSTDPAGSPDKYIWHYANGSWTNIPGQASQLAVDPTNNSLWVINSGGGIWHYSGGVWTSPGGGAQSIGVSLNGDDVFVVSNAGAGPDHALWQWNGGWQQLGGSGVIVTGNPDGNTYPLANGSIGANPGTFILNSQGQIWYENFSGGSISYGSLPGAASTLTQTTNGGVFVLSYPASASGNPIYYYDFNMPGWVRENGAGTSISTDGTSLYVVGGSSAIYRSPAQGLFFAGGTTSASFTSSGGSYSFPSSGSYNNVSVNMTWGSNDTAATFPVTVNWAYGADLPSSFVTLPTADGTALVYVDFYPGSSGRVSFTQTPAVTVTTSTSFPGAKCGFAFWGNAGNGTGASTPIWNPMTAVGLSEVTPTGNTFTIPSASLPPGGTVDVTGGQDQYFALYCH